MHADDLILVSVDDHLVEPPDMFEGRVPDVTATWRHGSNGGRTVPTCGPSTAP